MSIEHDKAVLREALDNFFVTRPLGEDHEPIPVARIALTCTLYFKNAHLPEVQHNVCECVRDFVSLIGEETKFCITADTSRCTLAKKRKLRIMDESMLHKIQEKGNKQLVEFLVASHDSMDEFNTMPPKFSLMTKLQIGMDDDTEDTIPLDKKVSYFSAVFAPSFFLLDKQPLTFTDLVLKWCNALRPLSGAAGWGVSQPSEEWRFLYAESLCAQELIQYPGLDKPLRPLLRDDSQPFEKHIASINWLTILCDELVERVGGVESLRSLGKEYPLARYDGGYIIQAGPKPELGNREYGEIPQYYGKVHDLLRPLYPPLEGLDDLVVSVYDFDPHTLELNEHSKEEATRRRHDFLKTWLNRYSPDVETPPLFRDAGPREDDDEDYDEDYDDDEDEE